MLSPVDPSDLTTNSQVDTKIQSSSCRANAEKLAVELKLKDHPWVIAFRLLVCVIHQRLESTRKDVMTAMIMRQMQRRDRVHNSAGWRTAQALHPFSPDDPFPNDVLWSHPIPKIHMGRTAVLTKRMIVGLSQNNSTQKVRREESE